MNLNSYLFRNYFLINKVNKLLNDKSFHYIDVGSAHHSSNFYDILKKTFKVTEYKFDPFEILDEKNNNYNICLSDQNKDISFFENENTQTSSVYEINEKYKDIFSKNFIKRKTLKVNKFKSRPLSSFQIEKINFLKIDTQGYVLEILNGGKDLLIKNSPLVLLEVWNVDIYKQAFNLGEIYSFMKKIGYVMLEIEKSHMWDTYNNNYFFCRSKKIFIACDVLFIKEEIFNGHNIDLSKDDFIKFCSILDLYGFRNMVINLIESNKILDFQEKSILNDLLINKKTKFIDKLCKNTMSNYLIRKIFNFNINGIDLHY
tara:strand:- start:4643 stop:5587 length:945 start_codon:yes stop_codon:yes gene_type:complete